MENLRVTQSPSMHYFQNNIQHLQLFLVNKVNVKNWYTHETHKRFPTYTLQAATSIPSTKT